MGAGGGGSPSPPSLSSRPLDLALVAFLVLHIPITIFLDSQSVFPREWYPELARALLDFHIETNKDPLVATNPPWFVSLVLCEIILQLPFFVVASWAIARAKTWIRIPAIIYGAHTVTTMVPILYEFAFHHGDVLRTAKDRAVIIGVYIAWLVVPLVLMLRFAVSGEDPFTAARGVGGGGGAGGRKKRA